MIRLVWAVDPFGDPNLLVSAGKSAAGFGRQGALEFSPVFALPAWVSDPEFVSRIRQKARVQFERVLLKLGPRKGIRVHPLEVLAPTHDAPENVGMSDQADEISEYAQRNKASSILVCTHARSRGHREWMIGSFAETLIERSEVPVISVQPIAAPPKIEELLFATDFSPESSRAYDAALDFARELRLPVFILHCLEPPTPVLDFAYSPYLVYANERRQERAHLESISWIERARRKGLVAQVRFEEEARSVAESIARLARERSSLIAISARSTPVASALLGSVTRKLVRIASNPVWVMHFSRRASHVLRRAA